MTQEAHIDKMCNKFSSILLTVDRSK